MTWRMIDLYRRFPPRCFQQQLHDLKFLSVCHGLAMGGNRTKKAFCDVYSRSGISKVTCDLLIDINLTQISIQGW